MTGLRLATRRAVSRRIAPLLAGIAGIAVVLLLIGTGLRELVFVVPALGVVGFLALAASRRVTPTESGWSCPSGARLDVEPAGTHPGPPLRPRPAARQVAGALARVEARELAVSPWFWVGVGFLFVSYVLFSLVFASDNPDESIGSVALDPWLAHPLAGMVVLAAHRGVTRARRDGTDELFDTCPVDATTRTWGSLGSAWVPVLALVAFFLVSAITLAVRTPDLSHGPGTAAAAIVLGALVLGAGAVVLGVTLGRWAAFPLVPVVAVVTVGFLSLRLAIAGDPGWNPLQQLATLPPLPSYPPVFTDPPVWWHLAWVIALTGAVLMLAVARHHRDRTVAALGVAACLLVAATGVASTRPMSGSSAARIAGLIADPARHQVCRAAGSTQVCVYRDEPGLADRLATEVGPLQAVLPAGTRPLTLRQRFPGRLDDLPPEVARLLPDGVPHVPADEVALGFKPSPEAARLARFLVALRALGLPVQPDPGYRPVVIAGQARGVVALWLVTRGLGPGTTAALTSGGTGTDLGPRPPDAFHRGYV